MLTSPRLTLPRVSRAAAGLLTAGALAGPAPALGHELPGAGGQSQSAHAREHAAVARAIERFDRLPAARRHEIRRALVRPATGRRARRAAAEDPALVGEWTSAPFAAPDYAINAVLLRGGRVLLFSMGSGHAGLNGDQTAANDGQATIWDPSLGEGPSAFTEVDPPPMSLEDPLHRSGSALLRPAPIFCAGQVQLADGRVLIAGGNLDLSGGGMRTLFLFDPASETWVREQDMARHRWYPTVTRLADGRAAIFGGLDVGHGDANSVERYPATNQLVPGVDAGALLGGLRSEESESRRNGGVYPSDFLMPSGRLASSYGGGGMIGLFEPTTGRWVERTPPTVVYGSYPTAFLRPGDERGPHEIEQVGGLVGAAGHEQITGVGFVVDPERETAWRAAPGLNVPRRNATGILLPDGSAVVVNGGAASLRFETPGGSVPANVAQRRVELWNPATGAWTLGPASVVPRAYHSTALLLPDGRVMAGGDDLVASLLDSDRSDHMDSTMEIYSPPYLFRGPRPQISAAPSVAGYGQTLSVDATSARPIVAATLVAPGSVTHAIDMNQRVLRLPVEPLGAGRYAITGPTSAGAAPPGDYMLFVVDDRGVPSIASWVRVHPRFPGEGTPVLTPLSGEAPEPGPRPTTPLPPSPDDHPSTSDAPPTPPADIPPPASAPSAEAIANHPAAPAPPASSATLRGRAVRVSATLSLGAAACPAKVSVRVTAGRAVVTRRLAARPLDAPSGTVCRAFGTLTLHQRPSASTAVAVRVSGQGVATLRLKATRTAG